MLLGDAARPCAGCQIFERLGLADSYERIAHDGLDEIENTKSHLSVRLHPMPKIFAELELKNSQTSLLRRHG